MFLHIHPFGPTLSSLDIHGCCLQEFPIAVSGPYSCSLDVSPFRCQCLDPTLALGPGLCSSPVKGSRMRRSCSSFLMLHGSPFSSCISPSSSHSSSSSSHSSSSHSPSSDSSSSHSSFSSSSHSSSTSCSHSSSHFPLHIVPPLSFRVSPLLLCFHEGSLFCFIVTTTTTITLIVPA